MTMLTIRASSLPGLFDCPARWYAQQVEGKRSANWGPAHLGTSLHHATAKFDQAKIEGSPIRTEDAIDLFADRLRNPDTEKDPEVCWDDKMTQAKAMDAGLKLTRNYCEEYAPTRTFVGVEIQCNPINIKMENGVKLTLTGQADRVRSETVAIVEGHKREIGLGICDVKSGQRIVSAEGKVNFEKHIAQLGTYELIEMLVNRQMDKEMVLPAEVIAMPTNGKNTQILSETVEHPSRILLGDGDKNKGLLEAAASMAKTGNFYGNPGSILCGKRYCPVYNTCWWRGHQE